MGASRGAADFVRSGIRRHTAEKLSDLAGICDEPLICAEIWRVIGMLKSQGQAILLVDKNIEALTQAGDQHYILEKGRVAWSGNSQELAQDTALQHRHLGL